ncbi:response regulator [Chloracidobacterium validum]|uniref:Response regulator n=1 Tax=Chloracidobacterium validum TaxID=2821543 RepID=A0ABX8B928_9BACT|nr:response regulator [Chloracidobacterium validum]QUW03443.1 response regulator [Chloracidobacterium validum]
MRRKVLLADDSLSIQKMFGLYLEKYDIDIITTSNGEMAISKLPNVCPDLILADVFMPGRSGYEVCKYVKQHPGFKHIPVLLLSGKFEPYDEKEAERVKADGHIIKPIGEQEFVSLIQTALERAGKNAAAPPTPIAQTQILGSVSPPVAPKEPSALGSSLPKFNFGSPVGDPSSEVPPPTIKVSPSMLPSMLDDGRLPDLEPLLPLDTAPPAQTTEEATDFILDLPPPEQAPPVLSYPEPPKTLSSPIARPTFSQMPTPDLGTKTARFTPSELPELLGAAVAPPSVDVDSPLELDDAPLPAAQSSQVESSQVVPAEPPPVVTEAPPATAAEDIAPVSSVSALVEPAPIETPDVVVTPPVQVAPPWSPSVTVEPPVTTPLETQAETSSLSPVTSSLEATQTSALLNEPIPPPDFLTGLVSPPAPTEPPAPSVESQPDEPPPSLATATTSPEPAGMATMPVFEVVMEDEPPVRGTDLLPDELLAIRNQQQVEPVPDTTSPPVVTATAPATVEEPVFQPFTPEPIPSATLFAASPTPSVPEAAPEADASAALDTPVQPKPLTATEASLPPVFALPPLDEEAAPVSEAESAPPAEMATEMATGVDATIHEPALPQPTSVAPASAPIGVEPTVVESVGASPAMESLPVTVTPTDQALPAEAQPMLTDRAPTPTETAPTLTMPPAAELATGAPDWSNFTLPQAVVDDIVRRVVAEISDQVIREIAWEVVPDLAELLIKKHLANGVGQRGSNA